MYGGSAFVLLLVLCICISCCCCCCGGSNRRCCISLRCSSCCQPQEYIANYAPPALENTTFKRGVSGRRLSGIDPDGGGGADGSSSSSSGGGASTAHLNTSGGRKATASGEFATADSVLQLIGGSAAVTPSIKPIGEEPVSPLTRDNSLHGGGGGGYLADLAGDEDEDGAASPSSPNPKDFKSWQTYTNAVEGKAKASTAGGGGDGVGGLKSALKKGDQLRRKDSVTKIAKYRKDKKEVGNGHLVMNAAYAVPEEGADSGGSNANAKFAANPVSAVEEFVSTPGKKLQPVHLTKKQQFQAKKDINTLKLEMEVHPDSRGNTALHPDGTRYPEFEKPVNMGRRVVVNGYECEGVLRFFGPHQTKPGFRCGVEMDTPVGKNNGKVNGHQYFICRKKHGVLCLPHKVKFVVYSDDDDDDEDGDGDGDGYLEVLDEAGEAARMLALGGGGGGGDPTAEQGSVARRTGGGGGGSTVRPRSQYSLSPEKMSPESRAEAAVPSSCVATHSFAPDNQDELGFEIGVRVQVLQQPDGGWWEGKVQGVGIKPDRQGWFPSNHVELEAVAVRPRSLYSLNPGKGLASPARESAGSSSQVTTCKVIHLYAATNSDELSFAIGDKIEVMDDPDGGWWHGRVLPSGEPGWFPSNHVTGEGGAPSSPTSSVRASNAAILERAKLQGWETYTATHDFEPRNEDECELVEGDVVSVVQKPDGGWWEVIVDAVHGWVPRSHLSDSAAEADSSA